MIVKLEFLGTVVQIRTRPESQFEFVPRDTEESEFFDLVDFEDVAFSVESVIDQSESFPWHSKIRKSDLTIQRYSGRSIPYFNFATISRSRICRYPTPSESYIFCVCVCVCVCVYVCVCVCVCVST